VVVVVVDVAGAATPGVGGGGTGVNVLPVWPAPVEGAPALDMVIESVSFVTRDVVCKFVIRRVLSCCCWTLLLGCLACCVSR
jgi:hypothetical protein